MSIDGRHIIELSCNRWDDVICSAHGNWKLEFIEW